MRGFLALHKRTLVAAANVALVGVAVLAWSASRQTASARAQGMPPRAARICNPRRTIRPTSTYAWLGSAIGRSESDRRSRNGGIATRPSARPSANGPSLAIGPRSNTRPATRRLHTFIEVHLCNSRPPLQAAALAAGTKGRPRRCKHSNRFTQRYVAALVESLSVDEADIHPSATLPGDLGAESIDFLDIMFRLEQEFDIEIPRGELFPESIFRGDPEFVQNGKVTEKGLMELRTRMPFADLSMLERDPTVQRVPDLLTVDMLTRYVQAKLGQGNVVSAPSVP